MKKLIIFIVLFTLFVTGQMIYAIVPSSDEVKQFLTEFIDNKPTGNYLFVSIIAYKTDNKVNWLYSETRFIKNVDEDSYSVDAKQSRSNDTFNDPAIENINWVLGKKIECKWSYISDYLNFLATKKNSKKRYDWLVSIKGKYKLPSEEKWHTIEYKGAKNITLKNNALKLFNLYLN